MVHGMIMTWHKVLHYNFTTADYDRLFVCIDQQFKLLKWPNLEETHLSRACLTWLGGARSLYVSTMISMFSL